MAGGAQILAFAHPAAGDGAARRVVPGEGRELAPVGHVEAAGIERRGVPTADDAVGGVDRIGVERRVEPGVAEVLATGRSLHVGRGADHAVRTEPAPEIELPGCGALDDLAVAFLRAVQPAGLGVVLAGEGVDALTGGIGRERGRAEIQDLGAVRERTVGVGEDRGTAGRAVGEGLVGVGGRLFTRGGEVDVEFFGEPVVDGDGEDLALDALAAAGAVDVAARVEEARVNRLAVVGVVAPEARVGEERRGGVDDVGPVAVLHDDGADGGADVVEGDGRARRVDDRVALGGGERLPVGGQVEDRRAAVEPVGDVGVGEVRARVGDGAGDALAFVFDPDLGAVGGTPRGGEVDTVGVVGEVGAILLSAFGDAADAHAEPVGHQHLVHVDGGAAAVVAVELEIEPVGGAVELGALGRDVDDAAGAAEAEEDGVGPAGIVDALDGVESRARIRRQVVARHCAAEAAGAEVDVDLGAGEDGVDHALTVEVAGVFREVGGERERLLERGGADVVEEILRQHIEDAGRVLEGRVKAGAGECVRGAVAGVAGRRDGERAELDRFVGCGGRRGRLRRGNRCEGERGEGESKGRKGHGGQNSKLFESSKLRAGAMAQIGEPSGLAAKTRRPCSPKTFWALSCTRHPIRPPKMRRP